MARSSRTDKRASVSSRALERVLLLTAAGLALLPAKAQAQSVWNGGTSDWNTAGNWSPAGVPTGADDVLINGPEAVLNAGADGAAATLTLGDGDTGLLSVSDGLTLSVGADTVLGATADGFGTLTIDAAAFNTDNLYVGDAGLGDLFVSNGGLLNVSNTMSLGADVNGDGLVVVSDPGSQLVAFGLLVGDAWDGELSIEDGGGVLSFVTLIGNDFDGIGFVSVTGAGSTLSSFAVVTGLDGQGDLLIGDGGTVTTDNFVIGANFGSFGGVYIGSDDPLAPMAPGVIDADVVEFGDGDGQLVFNHTSDAYTFAPALEGFGFVAVASGTTIFTADSSAFGGLTIAGETGVLQVDGVLGGGVGAGFFVPGGRIQGTGAIEELFAANFGVIAPGNSIGTLTVGDLGFDVDGVFEVEVNAAGASDQIVVGGFADIFGGIVSVLPEPGTYGASTTYTLIDAPDGNLTGAFDEVDVNSFLLRSTLAYDYVSGDVLLTLTPVHFFTPNQNAAAQALGQIGGGDVFDALTALADPASHIDQFTGEVHASLLGLNLLDVQRQLGLVRDRLGALAQAPSLVQLASLERNAPVGAPHDRAFWAQPFGAWGSLDGDGNAAGLDYSRAGLALGADARVGADSRVGVSFVYAQSEADIDARRSSADIDGYGLSAYGATKLGPFTVTGAIGYAWQDISTERSALVGAIDQRLLADYDASAWNAQADLAYPLDWTFADVEAFAGLSYVSAESDGFTERGGSAALRSEGEEADLLSTTLGLRASHAFDDDRGGLFGSLGWRHSDGDTVPSMRMAFATAPGVVFNIAGAPLSENAAAIEAGLVRVLAPNLTLTASYRGDLGEDASEHGAAVRIAWKN